MAHSSGLLKTSQVISCAARVRTYVLENLQTQLGNPEWEPHGTTRPVFIFLLQLALVAALKIMLEEGSLHKVGAAWIPSLETGLKRGPEPSPR